MTDHSVVLEVLNALTYLSLALSVFLLYRSYRRYRRAVEFRNTLRASNKNGVLTIAANGRVRRAVYSSTIGLFVIVVFTAFSLAIPSGPHSVIPGPNPSVIPGSGGGRGVPPSAAPSSGGVPVSGSGNGGVGSGNGVYGFILIGGLIGVLTLVTMSGIGDDTDTEKMLRYKDDE